MKLWNRTAAFAKLWGRAVELFTLIKSFRCQSAFLIYCSYFERSLFFPIPSFSFCGRIKYVTWKRTQICKFRSGGGGGEGERVYTDETERNRKTEKNRKKRKKAKRLSEFAGKCVLTQYLDFTLIGLEKVFFSAIRSDFHVFVRALDCYV